MKSSIFFKAFEKVKYLITGAVCGLLFNLLILKSPLVDVFPAYREAFANKAHSVDIITAVLLYCIAAPILEELIFRVFLYNKIYSRTGLVPAAIISSVIFGVYHMNMIQGIYAFIMGMIFCFFYNRDHRIWVPVLMHSGANLAVWLFSAFFSEFN